MSIKVEADVSKEAYELMLGLAGVVSGVKRALDDGWQVGEDLPAILSAVMVNLVPALQGVQDLPAEAMSETPEFVAALSLGAVEIFKAVK